MPNKDYSFHEAQKRLVVGWRIPSNSSSAKPDTATVHAQWVAIRTYSYVPYFHRADTRR